LFLFVFQIGSLSFAQADLRSWSSYLYFLRGWDYKNDSPWPACFLS
jgi:hypothetical protein